LESYFKECASLYDENRLPNKILFSGKKGLGKSTLAYHIINYVCSQNENNKYDKINNVIDVENKTFKLIQNSTHPNFYLIDIFEGKKTIDIEQIRTMITYVNKSNFNDNPRFVLIDNIESLNKSSINALLKIVEEPKKNLFFILIHNNETKILPTLISRCLTFKINLNFKEVVSVTNKIVNKNIFEVLNENLVNHYSSPGQIFRLINYANETKIDLKNQSLDEILINLIDNNSYKKNTYVKELLVDLIQLFFVNEYKVSNNKNNFIKTYHDFMSKIYSTNKFNLDEESLFLEFKTKLLNA
ncbi:AAA family ATPase, partial [Candidatus Pelagibacter bacterium]|nr:AAA family ATPase [Candidatus Pelagibacter bacterium]